MKNQVGGDRLRLDALISGNADRLNDRQLALGEAELRSGDRRRDLIGVSLRARRAHEAASGQYKDASGAIPGPYQTHAADLALYREKTRDVVPGYKQHERRQEDDSHSEANRLRPWTQGFAGRGLVGVEHQMPAVQNRNRKQIQESDRYGDQSGEVDEIRKADFQPGQQIERPELLVAVKAGER